MEKIDFDGVTLHRWSCGSSTYLVMPEQGARLMNWNLRMADGSVQDVIHWPENADYSKFADVHGGNPILFPFSARTFHAGKIGQWKDTSGAVGSMPVTGSRGMGSLRSSQSMRVVLRQNCKQMKLLPQPYPFNYRFTVRYIFEEVSFKVYLRLDNLGDDPIPGRPGIIFILLCLGTQG